MFFILLIFWLLLNGRITVEILATGAVICLAVYFLAWKFFDYSPRKEFAYLKRLPKFISYFIWLIAEIFRSAMKVTALIWSPRKTVVPHLAFFKTTVRTRTGRILLANSITMTPGTITIAEEDGRFTVHCLDETLADGLSGSEMEKRIIKTEE